LEASLGKISFFHLYTFPHDINLFVIHPGKCIYWFKLALIWNAF